MDVYVENASPPVKVGLLRGRLFRKYVIGWKPRPIPCSLECATE